MNQPVLWKLSVQISAAGEELISELLANWFEEPASSYTDLETGKTTVSVYLPGKPEWSRSKRRQLHQALDRLTSVRPQKAGSATITLTKLRPENWAEAWKRHFKPLEIGGKLLIRPSWSRRRPKPGEAEVVLDPGLSFGTGQHPTTSFCLRELARQRCPSRKQWFLDIGTGSGILAICAAKLGYRPVHAFDFDPDAVAIARANARTNKVCKQIRFQRRDLTNLPETSVERYSVICANLISDLLKEQRNRIVNWLESGGTLVLAGILKREFDGVRRVYEAAGLRLVRSRTEREWRSGAFLRFAKCR